MNKLPKVCIDKIVGQPPAQYVSSQPLHESTAFRSLDERVRAAILRPKMWPRGRTLTIRFLGGDQYVHEKVKEKAMDWTNYANIKFEFVKDEQDTDIRIAFQKGDGSWSTIGTDAATVDRNEPTMNLGWLDENTEDKEYSRVVKHEFGHALGLIHEHQNPGGHPIHWNKDAVYKALSGPPNNWDPATIDHNMFERYSKSITNYTNVDPQSIMMYWIPAEWTTDHKSYGEGVFDLSETDKDFMKKAYPSMKTVSVR
jgi:serralysin